MTRRFSLSALVAACVARAQQTGTRPFGVLCGSSDPAICAELAKRQQSGFVSTSDHPAILLWQTGPPLNRQCPVCGTMAPLQESPKHAVIKATGEPVESRGYRWTDELVWAYLPPVEQLVACARCRCAFGVMTESLPDGAK